MKFEVYQDKKDEWRWRLKHNNGNILAAASEGYQAKADVLKCVENVKNSKDAPVNMV